MAERTVFHLTPNGKRWQLKQRRRRSRQVASGPTERCRDKIQDEHTYRADPFPPRG